MKKIEAYFDDIPKNIQLENLIRFNVLEEIIRDKKVEKKHYDRAGVKEKLLTIFGNCCAFCEKRVETGAHIEHYRPKSKYYWLGATWSNFLIACAECNTAKSNDFEVEGNAATLPSYSDWDDFYKKTAILYFDLINELPKMLHPALDDWEAHLQFEMNGTITPKTNKGQYFLELCNISNWEKRGILINDRKYICTEIANQIKKLSHFTNDEDLKTHLETELLDIIKKIKTITTPHSAVYRSCFNNFNRLIIGQIEESAFRDRLKKVYKEICDTTFS